MIPEKLLPETYQGSPGGSQTAPKRPQERSPAVPDSQVGPKLAPSWPQVESWEPSWTNYGLQVPLPGPIGLLREPQGTPREPRGGPGILPTGPSVTGFACILGCLQWNPSGVQMGYKWGSIELPGGLQNQRNLMKETRTSFRFQQHCFIKRASLSMLSTGAG